MSWWDIDPFWPLLIISQLSGFGVVGIMTYWIMEYKNGQFSWGKNDGGTISYHSFMFTFGMVFLFGEAMLLFPVPKRLYLRSHFWRKVLHGCAQTLAVVFSIVGLKAIFLSKKAGGHQRFYWTHSWVGMASAMLFFLQHGVAIFFYVVAKFFGSKSPSARFMVRFSSMHTFFGYVLFAMAIASCLTGMDRWIAIFVPDYNLRPTPTLLGDIYALLMMLFGIVVAYLASRTTALKKKKSRRHTKLANGDRGEEDIKGLEQNSEKKNLHDNDHEMTLMKIDGMN